MATKKRWTPRAEDPLPARVSERPHPTWKRSGWWQRPWWRRSLLTLGAVVLHVLYASFACALPTLEHVDPLLFVAGELGICLPVACVWLLWRKEQHTFAPVRQGLLGGLLLGGGFVCLALAMRRLGIIPTAMLTALDGVIASLIAWLVFGQRPARATLLALVCASAGALLFWHLAPGAWQADLLALVCGLLFSCYGFFVERQAQDTHAQHLLPFWAGLLLSMSALALGLAGCFGAWSTLSTLTARDLWVLLYCGLGTVLLPMVLSTLLLRALGAVTLAFLALLEPLASIGIASLTGALSLPLAGWLGVGAILLSVLLQVQPGGRARAEQERSYAAMEIEDALTCFFLERE